MPPEYNEKKLLFLGGIFVKTIYLDEKKMLTDRKIRKIAKKIYKINKKEDLVVAISKNLKNNHELINEIESYNITVLDRKMAF